MRATVFGAILDQKKSDISSNWGRNNFNFFVCLQVMTIVNGTR